MKLELIIRSNSSGVDFALLKEGRLIELSKENRTNQFNVGDIFVARIRKILTGLNACFVNVGHTKDGFLHYHDLGPQVNTLNHFFQKIKQGKCTDYNLTNFPKQPNTDKQGNIQDTLQVGQSLLVQVVKEPISTKGPRLSTEISIAGRYMVLIPFSDKISISQKISGRKEKERLKRLVKSIKPTGFGVILRTVAQDKKVAELDRDMQNSLQKWEQMCKGITDANTPFKALSEVNKVSSLLRDMFNDSFTKIVTNSSKIYDQISDFLAEAYPTKKSILKLYKNKTPIFEYYNIERQIKTAFGKTVSMIKGAYLVIEHTEALHVIDVNSGNRYNKENSQEQNALEVNLIAATEIARQLRLRDMGGIIVVDFIDLHNKDHKHTLYEHLKSEMALDKAKHKVLPPSKFGLIQITRQRVRKEMNIDTSENNPCKADKVQAPITLIDKFETEIARILSHKTLKQKKIQLHTHPFIAAYIQKGLFSKQIKWLFQYRKWIKIRPRNAYPYLQYRFKLK